MAEQRPSGTRRKSSASKSGASQPAGRRGTAKAASSKSKRGSSGSARQDGSSGREAVLQAREQVSELIGLPVETVLGMERGEGEWVITVQIIELARIPNSTDVLGDYAVTVDDDGEVSGYRRTRRYYRNQADDR